MRSLLYTGAAVASAALLLVGAGCNGDDGGTSTAATQAASGAQRSRRRDDALADAGRAAPLPRPQGDPGQGAAGTGRPASCPEAEELHERVTPVGAWISTDGLSVGYSVSGETALHSCDAEFVDGRWERCSQKTLTLDALSAEELAKDERAAVCEDPPPSRGYVWVAVPSGTAWALVDHRSFWVAYFAVNQPAIRVSTTEGLSSDSTPGTLAFVDQDGRMVTEQEIEDGRIVQASLPG